MGMVLIHETPTSDPLALYRMKLEVTEQFAKVFYKPAEWNAIVRAGLYEGGMKWITDYLPLRFSSYARVELHYQDKPHRGNRGHVPLVVSGKLKETALSESWVEARATSSNASLTLHIATGMTLPNTKQQSIPYGNQPLVYETLTSITEREIGVIAMTMQETILGLIDGSSVTVTRKGTVRGSLTPTQKSGITHTARRGSLTHTQRAA